MVIFVKVAGGSSLLGMTIKHLQANALDGKPLMARPRLLL